MFLSDKYATQPHQLELPFEGKLDWCPRCNPTGTPQDVLRSMCDRHWREYNAAFDQEAFRADMKAALEEGRKAAEAFRRSQSAFRPPRGYFR